MSIEIEHIGPHTLYRADCRDVLPMLDKVDAVVTDPPYGNKEASGRGGKDQIPDYNKRRGIKAIKRAYPSKNWDDAPIDRDLRTRVLEIGRWKAMFGGNNYRMPASSCWLVWDKMSLNNSAHCELVWTNFPGAVRRIRYLWNGYWTENSEPRGDHPTQKPVGVMSWVIGHIPGEPKTILDPFMGSGTTGVACANAGISFIGIEREHDYFETACKRIEYAHAQLRLFA